ncbi:MAG: HAMP domain-containing histidine kinase [Calditrichaeota bacterium]|nr:HAMP domain-containing histidine kinase [Calditrichota bacterium]MCB0303352.1 HAMP domain-containing histidine kinase [Calditrichota bacterium]
MDSQTKAPAEMQHPFRKLHLAFLLISILASTALYWHFSRSMMPYDLKLRQQQPRDSTLTLFRDLDGDGYSERLYLGNYSRDGENFILANAYDGRTIDQFNFSRRLYAEWIFFGDCTGDNYEELFVYTASPETLYLAILDLNSHRWILRDRPLYAAGEAETPWDVGVRQSALLDTDSDGRKEIIFSLFTGYGESPRGVYVYDIEADSIRSRYEVAAGLSEQMLIRDVNGDGREEIVMPSIATGNIEHAARFRDDRCWLFVLDQQLQPVIPPASFGEYPGKLFCNLFPLRGPSRLMLTYDYRGNKDLPGYFYRLDDAGRTVQRHPFKERVADSPVTLEDGDAAALYVAFRESRRVVRFDGDFRETQSAQIDAAEVFGLMPFDFDGDRREDLLLFSSEGIHIFDSRLRPAAFYRLAENPLPTRFAFRHNGPGKPLDIVVNGGSSFYHLAGRENPRYRWLPWVTPVAAVILLLLLSSAHRVFAALYIFLYGLLNAMQKSESGRIILDHRDRIFYFNRSLPEILPPEIPLKRGLYYRDAFRQYPDILAPIETALNKRQALEASVSFPGNNNRFFGKIGLTPILSRFGLRYGCLIEVRDLSGLLRSERLKAWSATAQQIAHDINTPLGIITMNIEDLPRFLERKQLDYRAIDGLPDALSLIQEELAKIRELTRSFLKFADLENTDPRIADLEDLIDHSLQQFRPLIGDALQIHTAIDADARYVWVDHRQMIRVFHILIENAIDAMNGKGLITISACLTDPLLEKPYVIVEVKDNGPGIPAGIRDTVFEPYVTTKKAGTGMGLALARKMAADNGGSLKIAYSKERLGTSIQLSLPLSEPPAANQREADDGAAHPGSRQR